MRSPTNDQQHQCLRQHQRSGQCYQRVTADCRTAGIGKLNNDHLNGQPFLPDRPMGRVIVDQPAGIKARLAPDNPQLCNSFMLPGVEYQRAQGEHKNSAPAKASFASLNKRRSDVPTKLACKISTGVIISTESRGFRRHWADISEKANCPARTQRWRSSAICSRTFNKRKVFCF